MIRWSFRALKMYVNSYLIRCRRNVHCAGTVCVKDQPIIDVRRGGRIDLGDQVTLNSENRFYHLSLFAPTKLLARNAGARIEIGEKTRVHGSCIHATEHIYIGKNCLIAGNCQIFDCSGHDIHATSNRSEVFLKTKPIRIEDNVWIGTGSIILPGTHIGEGSVVAAGSVVRGRFAPCSLIAGNPAVLVKSLDQRGQAMTTGCPAEGQDGP